MSRLLLTVLMLCITLATPRASSAGLIDRAQANQIAQAKINELYPGGEVTYLPDKVEEYKFGWIYHVVYKKYVETHSLDYVLYGAPALLVERDGTVDKISAPIVFQHKTMEYLKRTYPRLFE